LTDDPTIDRDVVRPIVEAIDILGGQVDGLLDEVGLIYEWRDSGAESLSESRIWELFECTAQTMDMPAIGLQTGAILRIGDLGPFGRQLEQSLNLYRCLEEYINQVDGYSSHAKFWLDETANGFWFCRQGIDLIDVGRDYVEQFTLQLMIRLVQLATGRQWYPTRVRLQAHSARSYREYDTFDTIDIECSCQSTGVWVPRALMFQVIQREADDSLIQRLREVASIKGCPNLDTAAERLAISKRTLQRTLSARGLTWRRLVDQILLEQAVSLLESNEIEFIELAHQLGYTDRANFGRAFRRWTGTSPGTYRQMRLEVFEETK
jgi:AraC-like DNA-binding protein